MLVRIHEDELATKMQKQKSVPHNGLALRTPRNCCRQYRTLLAAGCEPCPIVLQAGAVAQLLSHINVDLHAWCVGVLPYLSLQ